mmetsp:Transcript_128651/g.305287  ORF Transcript_128651/g.305287 Transcript_128651/m.305287 type:complete len:216 (+) Transcript_128651:413-1060(+)
MAGVLVTHGADLIPNCSEFAGSFPDHRLHSSWIFFSEAAAAVAEKARFRDINASSCRKHPEAGRVAQAMHLSSMLQTCDFLNIWDGENLDDDVRCDSQEACWRADAHEAYKLLLEHLFPQDFERPGVKDIHFTVVVPTVNVLPARRDSNAKNFSFHMMLSCSRHAFSVPHDQMLVIAASDQASAAAAEGQTADLVCMRQLDRNSFGTGNGADFAQ